MVNDKGYTKIENLKFGEFFKRSQGKNVVYRRGLFERSLQKYSCIDNDDFNHEIFMVKGKEVFVNFEI
jgi:hypothetical protein